MANKVKSVPYNPNDNFGKIIIIKDVLLNFTDIDKNNNKFYRIILETNEKNEWRIYTSYGRVGNSGTEEVRYFDNNEKDALKEFDRIIKSKKKKDYREVELQIHSNEEKVISNKEDIKPVLGEILDKLIMQLYEEATKTLQKRIMTPLGKLSYNQIQKGWSILEQLQKSLIVKDLKSIEELSSQFYSLIPHVIHGRIEKNKYIIDSLQKVSEKQDTLKLMEDVIGVQSSLSASAYDKYMATGAKIDVLDRKNQEWSRIEHYVQSTKSHHHRINIHINNIFKIEIKEEEEKFNPYNVKNIQELFHGSRNANILGILQNGLLIKPNNVPHVGSMFGNGIYFADQSTKSTQYSIRFADNLYDNGFLLLADVALGKIKEFETAQPQLQKAPFGYNSVMGKVGSQLIHNEYIIYKTSQVRLKYLIDFTPYKG